MIAYINTISIINNMSLFINIMFGYPVIGRHVGGGRHVEMLSTPSIGWTLRHSNIIEHPSGDGRYAHVVDGEILTSLTLNNRRRLLKPSQLLLLEQYINSATELDSTWFTV